LVVLTERSNAWWKHQPFLGGIIVAGTNTTNSFWITPTGMDQTYFQSSYRVAVAPSIMYFHANATSTWRIDYKTVTKINRGDTCDPLTFFNSPIWAKDLL
jgi:hypothetical protein